MLLLSISYFIISIIRYSSSECCGGVASFDIIYPGYPSGLYMQCPDVKERCCGDCTAGTPFCGYDSCNIFGCSCTCRAGLCGTDADRRRLSSYDHALTKDEVKLWYNGNMTEFDAQFAKFDINKDNVLSINEIDSTPNTNSIIRGRQLLAFENDYSNWMSSLSDSLLLNTISLPGTHDTMTYNYDYDTTIDADWVMTQALSLEQNLNEGVRAFDIRCRHFGNAFTIHHGAYYVDINLDQVLQIFQSWLSSHPRETVVVRFKLYEHTDEDNTRGRIDTWNTYKARYPNLFYDLTTTSIPALGYARGKIVALVESPDGTLTDLNYLTVSDIQDEWNVDGDTKWTHIVNQMNKGIISGKFNINYSSASVPDFEGVIAGSGTPLAISVDMNPRLYHVLKSEPSKFSGITMMDYPPRVLIRSIIETNQG